MAPASSPVAAPGPWSAGQLVRHLTGGGPSLVALSGGVDSAVVASLAYRALADDAVAVTLTGPAIAASEVDEATQVAAAIGIRHVTLTSNPLSNPRYAENPSNRCYFCRRHEGGLLRDWGDAHSVATYLDGIHLADLGDDRPGIRAMDEHGFRHPLVEARWSKSEVRAYAQAAGLPNWDRPSNACLASRVAHGQPVTLDVLDRVGQAEAWLTAQGFRRVRVRVSGTQARVEVDPAEVPRLQGTETLGPLRDVLDRLGFTSVEVDPRGYRSRTPV